MVRIESLARAIAPDRAIEQGDGGTAIMEEERRLAALLAGDGAATGYRLWTNRQCLVTTRRFAAMPGFAAAAAASEARGWPVFVRSTGGTTVAHRPGMLNVSRFECRNGAVDIGQRFEEFCAHIVRSLRSLGAEAAIGAVPFSHCDGRFNICRDGRKIGGTASAVRSRGGEIAMLCHATIWISGDVASDLDAIEALERDLGRFLSYRRSAHASLNALQPA